MPNKKKKSSIAPSDAILTGRKAQPKKFSEEEQWLRDMWNEQEFGDEEFDSGYGILPMPRDPFMNRPTIIGKENARNAEKFFNIAPNMKGKIRHIQSEAGGPAIHLMGKSSYPLMNFGKSSLLGASSIFSGDVNLNPNLGKGIYEDYPPDEILAHEFTHLAGNVPEELPETAAKVMRKMKEKKSGIGPSK